MGGKGKIKFSYEHLHFANNVKAGRSTEAASACGYIYSMYICMPSVTQLLYQYQNSTVASSTAIARLLLEAAI